ncbi:MAG: stage V sporulation protein AD [Oscillospiraceae bacterium]|nr:stage V sporulation protein AD [Oscillospiraceae bacterium]
MSKKIGKQTIFFEKKPKICGFAGVAGKKESEGPIGKFFDKTFQDTTLGEKTWEKSEGMLQKNAVEIALEKAKISANEVDIVFAGDLLDQCISSTFGLKDKRIPFLGQFGACSTMAQTLILSSLVVDSGAANTCLAVTSSHFCSAERQYRFPLEYGGQRTPTAQWTVTGSGAAVVSKDGGDLFVNSALIGKIEDLGVRDSSNMGAAMAPAAAETIKTFFEDTKTEPTDYDLILTGDLGETGSVLLVKLLKKYGVDISTDPSAGISHSSGAFGKHNDCGLMIYDRKKQDVHAGGSGCGCSASVLCSVIFQKMKKKEINNVVFVATGALMSPTSFQQGETIPGIAHLVNIKI